MLELCNSLIGCSAAIIECCGALPYEESSKKLFGSPVSPNYATLHCIASNPIQFEQPAAVAAAAGESENFHCRLLSDMLYDTGTEVAC